MFSNKCCKVLLVCQTSADIFTLPVRGSHAGFWGWSETSQVPSLNSNFRWYFWLRKPLILWPTAQLFEICPFCCAMWGLKWKQTQYFLLWSWHFTVFLLAVNISWSFKTFFSEGCDCLKQCRNSQFLFFLYVCVSVCMCWGNSIKQLQSSRSRYSRSVVVDVQVGLGARASAVL